MKKQGTQWTSMCTTKVKGSTKLWGAQRSTELAFRSTDFHAPENLIFLALPFTPLWTQKTKILKKSVHIINLQMCTISDSEMMYGSWDMECNGENFLSFWTEFYLFTSLTTRKIKILKKWKKHLEIVWLYIGVP